MFNGSSSYALGVSFGRVNLPLGMYAKNDNKSFVPHFSPEQQSRIHDLLMPFHKKIGFFYEIGPGQNLLTVLHRPPMRIADLKDYPGILWLVKTGRQNKPPVYSVNYGCGREGGKTVNFDKALLWCRLHLETTFSYSFKPNNLSL
jgi:hypothetical protein